MIKRVDLSAVQTIQHYCWECPHCNHENIVTNEQYINDLGRYPYGQEVTCEECGETYTIDDVHY